MSTVSIVIPVYRSPATLEILYARISSVLNRTGHDWEIVFVDDSGPDGRAWAVLKTLLRKDPTHVVAIRLSRNFGQHNALMCGFHQATGDFVITMDDDLQNPPEEIPKLLDAIESSDMDLVYGSIVEKKKHGVVRNIGSGLVVRFLNLIFRSNVKGSSFRVLRKQLAKSILNHDSSFTFIDGLLAWNTQSISSIPVEHEHRAVGASGYSIAKLLSLSISLLTNFSLIPLQCASLLGFLAFGAGFLLGLYLLIAHWVGWMSVGLEAVSIVAIFALGGLQLLALGVIGEYLGRIHLNLNRKPQFVIRETIGAGAPFDSPPTATRQDRPATGDPG